MRFDRLLAPRIYLALVLGLLLTAALVFSLPKEVSVPLLAETGPFEVLTVVLYAGCAVLLWRGLAGERLAEYHLPAVPSLLAMRELDFDKRFTDRGILVNKFYTSVDVPILQKLVGVLVLLAIAYVMIRTLRRQVIPILRDATSRAWAWPGAAAFCFLFAVSKTIDGLSRKLADMTGIPRVTLEGDHPWLLDLAPFEEILELGLPAVMIMLSVQFLASRRVI